MPSKSNSDFKELEIPEDSKDVLAGVSLRIKDRIIKITFSEKFKGNEMLYIMDSLSDLSKIIKGVRKKVKSKVPEMKSEEDLYKIEDVLLRNYQLFKAENYLETDILKIEQKPEPRPNISPEEWQKELYKIYTSIKQVCDRNFPGTWNSIEFELSILKILNIKDCTLPFAGIILGPPSSSKTLGIELFRDYKNVYYTDSFSAKAFVSHNTSVKKEELNDIDMLPKIKNRCLLAPELSPIFSKKDDDLIEVLGIITRVLDGHGYQSDSGAHGRRGYSGEHMFTLIGAAVDIPYKVHKQLATLGPKLYFFRIPRSNKKDSDYITMLQKNDFNRKRRELSEKINEYLDYFDNRCPISPDENGLIKLPFDEETSVDPYILEIIVKLGKLLAHLRGAVTTWNTEKTQGSNYGYSTPTIEEPDRAMTQLLNLAKGHAVSHGRNYLTIDDIPILIKVVLSTASIERVMIFDLLLQNGGTITTSQISAKFKISKNTSLKTMAQLKVLGLVKGDLVEIEDGYDDDYNQDYGSHSSSSQKSITLESKFDWFLSEEFQKLRDGFVPEGKSKYDDNVEEDTVKKKCPQATKEKTFPHILKKYDDTDEVLDYKILNGIFWKTFEEIEKKERKINPILGPVLIKHVRLTNELRKKTVITTPEDNPIVITGEVVDKIINKLVREGKLAEPRKGQYYKIARDNKSAPDASAAA